MSVFGRLLRMTRAELEGVFSRSGNEEIPGEASPNDGASGQRREAPNPGRTDNEDPVLARYYANLELPYGADLETVHSAWRSLTRKYHPDLHSQDEEKRQVATELVKGLNEAYEGLKSAHGA